MIWEVCDTGVCSAEENMAWDREHLETLSSRKKPLLHFYEWEKPSATYGYFIDPSLWIDLKLAEEKGLILARRPTGGGIVFHLWDMAFSVLVPSHRKEFSLNTLENYAFIHQAVGNAVAEFSSATLKRIEEDAPAQTGGCKQFCMARPTKYDLLFQGKKIVGAAQRKTKEGFLHQGTISLLFPSESYLRGILKPGTGVLEAILESSYPLVKDETELGGAKTHLKALLTTHLNRLSLESPGI